MTAVLDLSEVTLLHGDSEETVTGAGSALVGPS